MTRPFKTWTSNGKTDKRQSNTNVSNFLCMTASGEKRIHQNCKEKEGKQHKNINIKKNKTKKHAARVSFVRPLPSPSLQLIPTI